MRSSASLSVSEQSIADLKVDPPDFDVGVTECCPRLEDARLAIGKRRVPGSEHQLARHQQARGSKNPPAIPRASWLGSTGK